MAAEDGDPMPNPKPMPKPKPDASRRSTVAAVPPDPVLEAASDLFAEKGLIVTFLWLQKETGVAASELTARFGSIDGLLSASLNYQLSQLSQQLRGTRFDPQVFEDPGVHRYWKVVSHAVLAGRDVARLQGRFPAVEGHANSLLRDPATVSKEAAFIAAAEATTLMIGWVLMEDFFVTAGRLDDVPIAAVRADVMKTVEHIGLWRAARPGVSTVDEDPGDVGG